MHAATCPAVFTRSRTLAPSPVATPRRLTAADVLREFGRAVAALGAVTAWGLLLSLLAA